MEYARFCSLVAGGEQENVDFKIECRAFLHRDYVAERAELVKDICAMANNGNTASYIIIGVSDDGQNFKSVANPKLTDDNIQVLCKDYLEPHPNVKVLRQSWPKADAVHQGKEFVIIKVGPHARRAFRISRDCIDYAKSLCHRCNEVWIRRGKTSDLARPEEVARLAKGQAPISEEPPPGNVQYSRLAQGDLRRQVSHDLAQIVSETRGALKDARLVLPFQGVRYVWRPLIFSKCAGKNEIVDNIKASWTYEHGILLLVCGAVPGKAFPQDSDAHCAEQWGYLDHYSVTHSRACAQVAPVSWFGSDHRILIVTLPKLADTAALRRQYVQMLQYFDEADAVFTTAMKACREAANDELKKYVKDGWFDLDLGSKNPFGLVKSQRPQHVAAAQAVLDLAAGRSVARAR